MAMELEDRVATLETEFKIIKGEIKALLLDVRETVNDMENPFRSPGQGMGIPGGMNEKLAEAKDFPVIENPLIKEISAADDIEAMIEEENGETFEEKALSIKEKFPTAEVKKFRLEEPEEEKTENKPEIQEMQDKILNMPKEPEIQEEQAKPEEAPREVPKITMENGVNTYTLVELMRWTDYTLSTIGRKRLEEVLDLYALTGHLPEKVKNIILNIAKLSTANVAEDNQVTMTDNITVISQLNEILSPEDSGQKILSRQAGKQKGMSLN